MQTTELSQQTADAFERDLARKLRQQISEWMTMRAPARTRTAGGVPVERRFRRRLRLDQLSA
jgi:hypothetical protein